MRTALRATRRPTTGGTGGACRNGRRSDRNGAERMITTAVCTTHARGLERKRLETTLATLAKVTRTVFHRVHQKGMAEKDVKRALCAQYALRVRLYSGCRADAQAAAKGVEGEDKGGAAHRAGPAAGAGRGARGGTALARAKAHRNAVATRTAEVAAARAEKALARGKPRHCFGGAKRLRAALRPWGSTGCGSKRRSRRSLRGPWPSARRSAGA